jgi:uncharacterized protein (DUF111 family)
VLRVILGEAVDGGEADEIVVCEANLDDTSPEVLGYCLELLLEAGALDAYCVPIYMKKSRPAALLTVLAEPGRVPALEAIVFAETATLGIRKHSVRRAKLRRATETVETAFGPIGVKVGRRGGDVITCSAEYEECRAAARRHGVPLKNVMSAAVQAWRTRDERG